jgi:two-component system cell cycle response regulator CpdR
MARILLATDDDSMRGFLAKALERRGHAVTRCSDGEEALDDLERATPRSFDLLLTDIVMPGLDGIELARRVVEIDDEIRIMFLTGYAAVALPGKGAPHEAKVLSKPFHLRQLVDAVDRVMAPAKGGA